MNHKLNSLMGVIESKRKDKMNDNNHILAKNVDLRRCNSVNSKVQKDVEVIRNTKGEIFFF